MNEHYIYAAGVEREDGYGMMAGPSPSLEDVKAQCVGYQEKLVIFRAKMGELRPYLRRDAGRSIWVRVVPLSSSDDNQEELTWLKDLQQFVENSADPACIDCDGTGVFYGNVCLCPCVDPRRQKP